MRLPSLTLDDSLVASSVLLCVISIVDYFKKLDQEFILGGLDRLDEQLGQLVLLVK